MTIKPYVLYNKLINNIILGILIFVVSGCTSGYSKFYVQRADDIQMTNLESLAEGKIPVIVKTSDLQHEFERYLAKNYMTIGESHFNGSMESDDNIIAQAMDVKATIVLCSAKYTNSQGFSTPLFTPNGFGGINSTPLYNEQRRYDQSAVFMAKHNKKPRLGVNLSELTSEQKQKYERNSGTYVRAVIEETPAFNANIVPGDVIITIDAKKVVDTKHALKLINEIPVNKDKVIIRVIRNGIEKDIEVILLEKADT